MFEPSSYSHYGAAEPSAFDQITGFLTAAAPALSVAQELIGKTDAEKKAILQAKVANYKSMRNKSPFNIVPGTAWYNNEIRKMEAQIKALSASVADEADTTRDYSIMRKLTSLGGLMGVGLGAAAIYYVIQKARK